MHKWLFGAAVLVFIVLWLDKFATAEAQTDSIRLDVPVIPAARQYVDLLSYPGYLAVALENNGLSPSLSSKLKVSDHGRSAEIRNAVLRFKERKGETFSYEAGVILGFGDSGLTIPISVDASHMQAGKVTVTLTPPLAKLIPNELIDRIRIKTQLIASLSAQQKMLEYLNRMKAEAASAGGEGKLVEAILLDAYNRGGGPAVAGGRDVGDAVPLSEQWLLILTLLMVLVVVPVVLLVQRIRMHRRRAG